MPKKDPKGASSQDVQGSPQPGESGLGLTPAPSLIGILFPHLSKGDNGLYLAYCQQLPDTAPGTSVTLSPFILPTAHFTDKERRHRGQAM